MGILLGIVIAFLAGCIFGAILGSHSAKMRDLAKSVDDEFAAAEASLKAKIEASKASVPNKPAPAKTTPGKP